MTYDDHPFIAIWEVTQACDLVCQHCRACAQPRRDPRELTTAEGFRLLDRFAEVGVPLVVLTGGDPAKRPDLVELVQYGSTLGLNMALTPSSTPLVTRELVEELQRVGLKRLAVSIDGADAATHDAFRGVRGSFAHALRILRDAQNVGLRTQVNTTIHTGNIASLRDMADRVASAGSVLWSVFHLVPTGRAEQRMLPTAEAVEGSLNELAEIAMCAPFAVKTTAAPHYRRIVIERRVYRGGGPQHGVHGPAGDRVNDGRGFLFVSHLGAVYPSGFLPIDCGNVREADPIDVYRHHPLFRELRNSDRLTGKCAACVFRRVCGGSRARAFAMTGNALAADPLCAYVPPGYVEEPVGAPPAERQRRRLQVV